MTKFIVKTNSRWLKKTKIAGNANFMVNSKLTGDELEIKANDNCLVQFKKSVEVGVIDLDVSGSANMVIEELKADKLNCNMGGSGSIRLKNGSAKQGNFTTLSSGDIHAFGIAIPDVKCKMAGSGLMEIHPTANLNASLVGKGNIRYKGPATVQQRTIGKRENRRGQIKNPINSLMSLAWKISNRPSGDFFLFATICLFQCHWEVL